MGRGAGKIEADTASVARSQASGEQLHELLAQGKPIFRLLSMDPQFNEITWLARQIDEGELDVNPPYQRGSVWGEERKRNLIRSLAMGLPIGSIFINRRSWTDPEVVVDGKQRLLTVKDWIQDRLAVPASWFEQDQVLEATDGMVRYSGLAKPTQRAWRMQAGIQVYRTKFGGDDAVKSEAALFELINYGGVPQGQQDPDA